MYQVILMIHVFVAVCIVALVLVQQGKGATLGAAFGSGASQTIFGSRGSGSFLFRLTIGFVCLFFITSVSLNYLVTHAYKKGTVIELPVNMPVRNNVNNGQSSSKPVETQGSSVPVQNSLPTGIPARK